MELLAKDKGIHCEVESEESRTQTLILTNRNIIQEAIKHVIEPGID
ncbi:hypothetical protein [Staphylococcus lutrae]|nr:hypothetical protein [Staphylococcus lutrae]